MAEIDQDKIFYTKKQVVEVEVKKNTGRILDIGGGGEAIIGQIYGDNVVAIDINEDELLEAPENDALQIIMDARDMGFTQNQFEMVTSFFTLMYLEKNDIGQVFKEVKRVLKPNRSFIVWDLDIPPKKEHKELLYAARLAVKFNNETIDTGYGVKWQDNNQNVDTFINLAKDYNFSVLEKRQGDEYFYLELRNNK
ncbi:MAG TPA: class I SAM-dependent methyltransferase [Halanaerobiales bacterium]|nr:class I SAM-dependent methyltransferase [Halanaerobiales bacterium]